MSLLLPLIAQAQRDWNPFPSFRGPTAVVAGYESPACVKQAGKSTVAFLPENRCQNTTKTFESWIHIMQKDKSCPSGTVSLVQGFSELGCQGQVVVRRGDQLPCLNYTVTPGGQSVIFSCVADNPEEKGKSLGDL